MKANDWASDPELVATFRAEVDERLASLCAGLLLLEEHRSPRQLVTSLFRDVHTVKGSARMLGLDRVVGVAHRAEDLLGALRDGRMPVRRELVDVLLVAAEGISRSLPGAERPVGAEDLAAIVAALDDAVAGKEPLTVPRLAIEEPVAAEAPRGRSGNSIRVSTRRVHDLLDVVGEAELDVRRVTRKARDLTAMAADQQRLVRRVRDLLAACSAGGSAAAADGSPAAADGSPAQVADAVHALAAAGDELAEQARDLHSLAEDAKGRMAAVRGDAMGLAMVPLRRVAAGFPQLVRELTSGAATDAARKDVRLVLTGQEVELDTRVLDAVADSLRHLVINAVDHGCETVAERVAAGKPGQATVTLSAKAAGSTVVIEVSDDGHGVDEVALRAAAVGCGLLPAGSSAAGPELLQTMFAPAFSTRTEVTETSGRGVGLDVVRTVVEDLSGVIGVRSQPGLGTVFVITLPVTLGVLRCLIARIGAERYALPVSGVVETIGLRGLARHEVAGVPVVVRDGRTFPLVDLGTILDVPGDRDPRAAVVVRHGGTGELLGLAVDELESELEVVVKELGGFLGRLPTVTGATIDGDGSVVLVLDVREIAVRQVASGGGTAVGPGAGRPSGRRTSDPRGPSGAGAAGPLSSAASAASSASAASAASGGRPHVLVVEDSVGVRELQRVILEGAGYEVSTAVDGLDGASRLAGQPVDLVLSDVEMPGMDGFTLTRTIRRTPGWEDVPVVIMTSRGDQADQRAGLDAGASAYLLKSEFDQVQLIDTVRRLVGR